MSDRVGIGVTGRLAAGPVVQAAFSFDRIIGIADMAHAIRENRPHRASAALAMHVLEVMEAFAASSEQRRVVPMTTRPERPALQEEAR